jgi:uncharacterized protein (DUF58 family)
MILPTTRWYVVAACLAVLAPLSLWLPPASTLLWVADIMWVVAFVADALMIGAIDLRTFPVRREAPPAFSVGRPLPVTYWWTNPSSRSLRLRIREEVPAPLRLGGSRQRDITLDPATDTPDRHVFDPWRRGKVVAGRFDLRLRGRWGLAWRQGTRALPWHVTVYPGLRAAALRALPPTSRRRRELGNRAVRHRGEGRAFESLREWVPGDEQRSIDWKATARRGKLMSRQYEDERRQNVMLMIDAGRMLTAEIDGRARLEAAIDAALELAYSAVLHDDNVGLMVFADQVLHYVAPTRGRRALRRILDTLAAVDGRLIEPDYPAAFAWLAVRNRKRALTVLFTDVIDRTASDALVAQLGSLRPRHLPLAVTLRDPALERLAVAPAETVDDAFRRAAAEELLGARELALAELRARGVLVLDVLPTRAARAVVDQYEQLKRRALV